MDLKRNIKDRLLNFYSKRNLKKDKTRKQNVGFQNCKEIGLVFKYQNKQLQKDIDIFASEIKKYGKKLDVICFIDKDSLDYDYKIPSFKYEDINYKGNILDKNLNLFLQKEFEYLFFVDFELSPILGYIISKSKAKCKIGYFEENMSKYFDLMVNFEKDNDQNNLKELTKQMIKYAKIL